MTVRTLTGTLVDIGASPASGVSVTFSRSGVVAQYGDVVLPRNVTAITGPGGGFSQNLLPGRYLGHAKLQNGSARFTFALAETGSTDLADILEDAEIVVTPQIVADTRAARDEARQWAEFSRDGFSVKSFGAVGNGVADDTAALNAAFTHVASNGGELYVPAGNYAVTNIVSVVGATKPFSIIGAGPENTKITRASNFNGSVVSISDSDNWSISGLTIDGKHSIRPNGNHGLVFFDCQNVRIHRVNVVDWKNSAILGYASTPGDTSVRNVAVSDCVVDGLSAANNGILLVDHFVSGLENCQALNIGKTGSPCYGLQLKNGCEDSWIRGGYTSGARIGVACGNSDVTVENRGNRISDVTTFDCNVGLALGDTKEAQVSNCHFDMNTGGESAIDFNEGSVGCSVVGAKVSNLAAGKFAVKFRNGDTDNYAEVLTITNSSGLAQKAAEFGSGAVRNSVRLGRYVNPTTVTSTTSLVDNLSGGSTNRFDYEALPRKQVSTIDAGAVTLQGPHVSLLQVETESLAATDDLDTISGGVDGQIITLETTANARDVTVKNLTGNIALAGGADCALTVVRHSLTLVFKSGLSQWCEVSRVTT